MNKSLSKYLLIFLICLTGMQVEAQQKYKFKSIQTSDGLANSTVQALFEDSYGFMWLGTQHGLQRYDGKSYTTFTTENSDSTGLSHNFITGLCEDNEGDIWVASGVGLNRYSRQHDKIKQYRWKGENVQGYDDIAISRIIHDREEPGILWMTSGDSSLIRLNIKTEEAITYNIPNDRNHVVLKEISSDLFSGHLLVGTTELYLFNKTSGKYRKVYVLDQKNDVLDNRFNDLVLDPSNSNVVWCAIGDHWGRGTLGGLLKIDLETGESNLYSPENRPGEIPDWHILTVCFYGPDKLWVGTRNHGVLLYDLKQDTFSKYSYNEYDEGSLVTENAIRSMHLDRSGTMWFGTWGDGVSILSPARQKFTHYKHLPNVKGGLSDNWITGITEDMSGNIWIGTKAGGLSKFDPDKKIFENYFREFATIEKPTEITYVHFDSRNNLWIGTYANALYRYNPVTGEKIHYPKGNNLQSVSQKRISAIAELVPGEILVSTYGGGLNVYNYETDAFVQFVNNPDDSTSIPDNQIWIPFLGDDGNYYMGGNSVSALIKFNQSTKQFSEPLTRPTLNTMMQTVKDSRGRIIVDALSLGLSELVIGDTIQLHPFEDNEGKHIIGGESLALDAQDNIWSGTTNGLVKFNPDTKEFIRYNPDDGLQGYSFYRFASHSSTSGTMYFGGLNGLNIFNPEEIKLSDYQPPVVLTGFKLFQENMEIGENSPLKKNILIAERIELKHNENDFSISFSGLDYSNPHKIQYKYQLVNHDDHWISTGNLTVAGYTNMDPGNYTFMVRSTNADGVWNDKTTSLEIIIKPPWWQTTAAFIAYALIFIFLFIMVDKYQRKRLKERERERAREKELTQAKEIEKAYHELKTTQQQLVHSEKMASLGELTAGIAHEIQNPLNFVNNFSEVNLELIEEVGEEYQKGDHEEVEAILRDIKVNENKISTHGKRAESIVKSMLQHSRGSTGQKEMVDINALTDEYLRLAFHGLRAKDKSFNADFKIETESELPKINVVPQDIGRVLLNLFNNAFFAVSEKEKQNSLSQDTSMKDFKPLVIVSTQKMNDTIEISVEDNGNGIPEDVKKKIFQPFFTTKPTGEGTGLGLSLSYDIIKKGHNGDLRFESEAAKGSKFVISLPL